jgi:hypothetical protein
MQALRSPGSLGSQPSKLSHRHCCGTCNPARTAGVDRTFLYRHRDLLTQLHALATQPANAPGVGPTVSRASLQTDRLAAQERARRVQQLERRLSEALGQQAWRESGLGASDDIDRLKRQIIMLEQQAVHLRLQLEERDQELYAARATNREFMARLNTQTQQR